MRKSALSVGFDGAGSTRPSSVDDGRSSFASSGEVELVVVGAEPEQAASIELAAAMEMARVRIKTS